MVIIKGIAANRVAHPNNISMAHTNSAKTAKVKVTVSPNPIGSAKAISSLPKNVISFGTPWVSIKPEINILNKSKPKSVF